MTAATEKKPDDVPPAVVDEESDEEGEEDGAPEGHAGGKCFVIRDSGVPSLSGVPGAGYAGEGKKKKKKKKPKKKKAQQTEPPTIGLSKLFPDGKFPEGELQEYKSECVLSALLSAIFGASRS